MSRYSTTNVRSWKARKSQYFEILDREDPGNIKRISNKNVELLILEKQKIEKEIKDGLYGLEFISLLELSKKFMKDFEAADPSTSCIKDYNYLLCAMLGRYDGGKNEWKGGIKYKGAYIRNMGIKEFTVPIVYQIQKYFNKNFGVRNNKQAFGLLTRLFKFALNENLGITMNPCRDVDRSDFKKLKEKYEASKPDPVAVQGGFDESLKKLKGILEKLKGWNFQHYVMVRLMCELGGRPGEVLPLLIQDYNPGSKSIDINKTVNTLTNELHHMTKTLTGMRTVALSTKPDGGMAALIEKLIYSRTRIPGDPVIQKGLLFPSTRGTIIQGNNFANRILNKFNKELGIVGRINPHSLRVFVITLRDYLNHKKKNMMRDAGHASKQISDHYVRGKWVNHDENRKDQNEIAGLLE